MIFARFSDDADGDADADGSFGDDFDKIENSVSLNNFILPVKVS